MRTQIIDFLRILDKLKRYFRDYGIVQDAVVMKDPVTKRSRGFGFITFFDGLSVDSVLAAEPHVIDGRKVGYWDSSIFRLWCCNHLLFS